MRRPDPLEWLLIAAALLAFAALAQSVFVAANAGLVETLTASVTASRAASAPASAADGGDTPAASEMSGAVAAIDDTSSAMAAKIAAELDRGATWLAATNGALLLFLVVAVVMRARQLRRRVDAPPAG